MKKCIMYLWNIIGGRNEVHKIRQKGMRNKVEMEDNSKPGHRKKDLEDNKKSRKRKKI